MPYKDPTSIGMSKHTKDELEKVLVEKGLDEEYESWDEVFQDLIRVIREKF